MPRASSILLLAGVALAPHRHAAPRAGHHPDRRRHDHHIQERQPAAQARADPGASRPTRGPGSRSTSRPTAARSCSSCSGDLYTLPIGGGEARRITAGLPFDSQPRYSPDGKRIVFLSDRDGAENVWTADADGTRLQQVTKGTASLYASPEWTPGRALPGRVAPGGLDQDQLPALAVPRGRRQRDQPDQAGHRRGRGRERAACPASTRSGAAFGPDGRYVWYARHQGGFGYDLTFPQWQLATYDRETGKVVVQSDLYGSSMRPVLSPDGKWLVYATRHDGETGLRLRELATGSERWLRWPVQRDDQESRLHPRSHAGLGVHARRQGAGHELWRPASGGSPLAGRRAGGDPVPRAGGAAGRTAGAVRVSRWTPATWWCGRSGIRRPRPTASRWRSARSTGST